jgi:hypothetical protein
VKLPGSKHPAWPILKPMIEERMALFEVHEKGYRHAVDVRWRWEPRASPFCYASTPHIADAVRTVLWLHPDAVYIGVRDVVTDERF